jgi:hypothetical protein
MGLFDYDPMNHLGNHRRAWLNPSLPLTSAHGGRLFIVRETDHVCFQPEPPARRARASAPQSTIR